MAFAQAPSATLNGQVVDKLSNQPIPFAPVQISGTTIGTTTDEQGRFEFRGLTPGIYNIEVTSVGYDKAAVFEIDVSSTRVRPVRVELVARSTELEEVTVRPDPFVKLEEAPVSVYNVGEVEIKRNPGANRDISKALQSLPGVAATASFRNDLIIRGGSSNENRFYLDGIEVPNINHFATQGSTGGPVGMINVDFIREVDFYSSAFPAARGNTLSSVMDFKLKEGRAERMGYTLTLGASDLAATVDGPLSEKVNFIASWRRSYLQFLFKAIGLPFLPTYDDFLVKTKWKIDDRNEITFLGLGADDRVRLNLEQDETDLQQYLLNNLPVNTQWNYTVGAVYRRYRTNGYSLFALSRNQLQNDAEKFQDNDASSENNRLLDYSSRETENKFRYEQVERIGNQKLTFGMNLESAEYTNRTFNRVPYVGEVRYQSDISFTKLPSSRSGVSPLSGKILHYQPDFVWMPIRSTTGCNVPRISFLPDCRSAIGFPTASVSMPTPDGTSNFRPIPFLASAIMQEPWSIRWMPATCSAITWSPVSNTRHPPLSELPSKDSTRTIRSIPSTCAIPFPSPTRAAISVPLELYLFVSTIGGVPMGSNSWYNRNCSRNCSASWRIRSCAASLKAWMEGICRLPGISGMSSA